MDIRRHPYRSTQPRTERRAVSRAATADPAEQSKTMTAPRPRPRLPKQPRQLDAGPLEPVIGSFALHLAAEGKAARTVQGYTSAVRWFAVGHLAGQHGKTSWEQVDAQDIQRWMTQLLHRYSNAYASIQFRALRHFFKWRADEEELPDPMARLRAPKIPVTAVPVFTSVELSELGKACQGRSFAAMRRSSRCSSPRARAAGSGWSRSRLGGQGEQRTVAAAFPAARVGCGEQHAGFGVDQERDRCAVEAFLRDGQHLLDELGVLGMAQRSVAEQRAQRGQPGVAAAGGVPAAVLEVVQERRDRIGAQIARHRDPRTAPALDQDVRHEHADQGEQAPQHDSTAGQAQGDYLQSPTGCGRCGTARACPRPRGAGAFSCTDIASPFHRPSTGWRSGHAPQ